MKSFSSKKSLTVRNGNIRFVFPDPENFKLTAHELTHLDEIISGGVVSAREREIRVSTVTELAGRRVFLKTVTYPRMQWRYIFRRSRFFECGAQADMISALNIPTPQVLGAGECRRTGRLYQAWAIFEAVEDAVSINDFFKTARSRQEIAGAAADMMQTAALLHKSGIYHGDLNLNNCYYRNGVFSLWDLDTCRKFRKVPDRLIKRELTRTAAAIFQSARLHVPHLYTPGRQQLEELTGKLLAVYSESGAPKVFTGEKFAESVIKRLYSKYGTAVK